MCWLAFSQISTTCACSLQSVFVLWLCQAMLQHLGASSLNCSVLHHWPLSCLYFVGIINIMLSKTALKWQVSTAQQTADKCLHYCGHDIKPLASVTCLDPASRLSRLKFRLRNAWGQYSTMWTCFRCKVHQSVTAAALCFWSPCHIHKKGFTLPMVTWQ